ncbi:DUF3519 domain-containing protein [Helicobacter pylori]
MKLPKALNEATAGAALKYHLKRALERSHSISEFSKNLELSAQNAKFSNNTLKIIEELTNGVKQASEEIKAKATKYEKALQELQKIDESKLTKEQQQVLKVFKGELDQTEIKGIDLNDLYILEQGTRHAGAKKILVKHYGAENTGGLTNDELINMSEVIKNGSVLLESFERLKNGFRYGYEWDNNGVKLRLVVDDLNDGNKVFDFYSDRNFKDFRDARPQPSTSKDNGTQPITLNENNLTQKPLTSQEDLLKNTELNNETTQEVKNLSPLEQANAEKLAKLETEKGSEAEAVKKLDFGGIKKLIDESPNNGKDIILIGDNNLTPEIVEYIHKKHAKVGIERLDENEIRAFNFTYPKNAKAIIDYQGIQHALNKHGINSPSVKFSKQPPITYEDIANYRDIVKNADETIKRDNRIISYKQVNGHFVVVEQINRNKSEFIFKTMFKEKGDYKNAPDYKKNIKEKD